MKLACFFDILWFNNASDIKYRKRKILKTEKQIVIHGICAFGSGIVIASEVAPKEQVFLSFFLKKKHWKFQQFRKCPNKPLDWRNCLNYVFVPPNKGSDRIQ